MMLLKDHRRALAVTPQRHAAGENRFGVVAEYVASRRAHQSVEASQQRGFARPRRTKQHNESTAVKSQRGAVQCTDTILINDGCAFDPEQERVFFTVGLGPTCKDLSAPIECFVTVAGLPGVEHA